MTIEKSFDLGVVAGILLMLGGDALHWFITPLQHPDASTFYHLAVGAEAVFGLGGAVWLIVRRRSASSLHALDRGTAPSVRG